MVEDSPAGYRSGIEFFSSEAKRKEFGINAARHADAHWEPAHAERIFADIHRELTGK